MNLHQFSRKKFLKHTFKTGTIIALAPLSKSLFAFSIKESESYRKDPLAYAESIGISSNIQKIILCAMLAPNSHNTQPWKVRIDSENSFTLFGDAERTLPAIDPINRQFYHSQGTFLELARLAADSLMFDAKVILFPSGIPTSKQIANKAIAKFTIIPKDKCVHDFLFLSLPKRQMNRAKYSGEWITEEEVESLKKLTFANYLEMKFVLGEENIKSYFEPLHQAFITETNLREANEVSRVWFRTETKDIFSKRDGITLEGNGLSGFKLWLVKKFFIDLSTEGWHSESSKKGGIDLAKTQIESSKALVFFITEGKDSAQEWVKTGTDFMRFTLAIANQNLAFHTMNQALEDYKESGMFHESLKQQLGLNKNSRIQLMGRIGRSDFSFASPRRELKEILI
jgi:hypothetical protein